MNTEQAKQAKKMQAITAAFEKRKEDIFAGLELINSIMAQTRPEGQVVIDREKITEAVLEKGMWTAGGDYRATTGVIIHEDGSVVVSCHPMPNPAYDLLFDLNPTCDVVQLTLITGDCQLLGYARVSEVKGDCIKVNAKDIAAQTVVYDAAMKSNTGFMKQHFTYLKHSLAAF